MFCPSCGERTPDDSSYCEKCGSPLESQTQPVGTVYQGPDIPPAYEQPQVAANYGEYRYAGFWARVGSHIIDVVLINIVSGILGFILGIIVGLSMMNSPEEEMMLVAQGLGFILGVLIAWLYYGLMESSQYQATVGKQAIGAIVINKYGERISFGQASGRYFGKILSALLFCIGFIMVGLTEKKQGLHDLMAGTYVIFKQRQ